VISTITLVCETKNILNNPQITLDKCDSQFTLRRTLFFFFIWITTVIVSSNKLKNQPDKRWNFRRVDKTLQGDQNNIGNRIVNKKLTHSFTKWQSSTCLFISSNSKKKLSLSVASKEIKAFTLECKHNHWIKCRKTVGSIFMLTKPRKR